MFLKCLQEKSTSIFYLREKVLPLEGGNCVSQQKILVFTPLRKLQDYSISESISDAVYL